MPSPIFFNRSRSSRARFSIVPTDREPGTGYFLVSYLVYIPGSWPEQVHLQLFRQRFSHKSVKAYATMPIGIMGRMSLAFIDWGSRVFTNKKRSGINTFVSAVSPYVAKKPKASINDNSITPFGIVAYAFVGQPFSKQLYMRMQWTLLRRLRRSTAKNATYFSNW